MEKYRYESTFGMVLSTDPNVPALIFKRQEPLVTSEHPCPRCTMEHPFEIYPFTLPMSTIGPEWQTWAICSISKEPVIFQVSAWECRVGEIMEPWQ